MLNIEKYKDEIYEKLSFGFNINYCLSKAYADHTDDFNPEKEKIFDWLLSEYKELLLTDSEKNYLSSIIKPFRDRVIYIGKFTEGDDTDKSFIEIGIDGDLEIVLPSFAKNKMYLGMKEDRKYVLKELGL